MTGYLHFEVTNVYVSLAGLGNPFPVPVLADLGRPPERAGLLHGTLSITETAGASRVLVAVYSRLKQSIELMGHYVQFWSHGMAVALFDGY